MCGDSFFTKCSSCSFNCAAHPNNPLNPLHPSITPLIHDDLTPPSRPGDTTVPAVGTSCTNGIERETNKPTHDDRPKTTMSEQSRGRESKSTHPVLATIDDGTPKNNRCDPETHGVRAASPRDGRAGEAISIMPLSGVGKAPQCVPQILVESKECQVFEVALQQQEVTVCPSCARSPRRAALPAHARGCLGLS
jgi:hypothetical protein